MELEYLWIFAVLLLIIPAASTRSVGAAPGSIEFGEVEGGETLEKEIYVTTNIREGFRVEPSTSSVRKEEMFDQRFIRSQVSEEDVSDWVSLEDAFVNHSRTIEAYLSDGTPVSANGQFTMVIDVPSDAEPGYHFGSVGLNPQIETVEGLAGSTTLGVTNVPFRFNVEGDVRRSLQVEDVRAFRQGEDRAEVEVLLRNTGTVTTSAEGFPVEIYDQQGRKLSQVYPSDVKIPPQSSEWVSGLWNSDQKIDQGRYQINGNIDYITGSATASGSFSLPGYDVVEVRPGDDGEQTSGQDSVPIWLVLIILVILGVLMWGFNIEPFWILTVLGFLGVLALILLTGLPNYSVLILILLFGILLYGGM